MMDSLQQPEPVIIYGVSGCGKSTLAKHLCSQLGQAAVFIDADDHHGLSNKAKMAAGVALSDEDRAQWLADLNQLLKITRAGNTRAILACSALSEHYRLRLSAGLHPTWCHLALSPDEARARVSRRQHHYMPASLVESQFQRLEVPHYGLHLNATEAVETLSRQLMNSIVPQTLTNNLERLPVPDCDLGEGPCWNPFDDSFYWVDIVNARLHRWQHGQRIHSAWQFEKNIGCLGVCSDGRLVIGLADEVILFNPSQGLASRQHLCDLDTDIPGNRANDGKVDPWGNFWVGTMSTIANQASGRLWRIDAHGNKQLMEQHLGIANTFAWTQDKRHLYFGDSTKRTIWRYPLTPSGVAVSKHKQIFFQTPTGDGVPDGSSIDNDDHLWNAQWNRSRIERINPQGEATQRLHLPTSLITSCCFGGRDLNRLLITSAKPENTEVHGQNTYDGDQSGSTFIYDSEFRGRAPDLFDLSP